jgi:DNA-binding winged helix-turn-helix (wHTH) protein/TolB-like protein
MAQGPVFSFGRFRLDSGQRLLFADGEVVLLEPKVFETLLALVEGEGRLLSKEELLQRVWPDSFVEEGSLTRNVSTLRRILGETTDTPYIATIPKRGYRFVAPVVTAAAGPAAESVLTSVPSASMSSVPEIRVAEVGTQTGPAQPAILPSRRLVVVWGIVLGLLLGGAVWWARASKPNTDEPTIRSLAVLPLRPLVQSSDENYIGLGIADTIIAGVSRAPALAVRPTSAIRQYIAPSADIMTAARELEVDAVLDGTWFREVDRLRVSLNLIRTADSHSLWTETFDIRAGDLFAIQDQVAGRIAGRLRAALTPAGSANRRAGTENATAYDLYTKGRFYFGERGFTVETRAYSDIATSLFERAVAADPNFAEAHAMLGFAYAWTAVFVEENAALIERAESETDLAQRLDDRLGQVHLNRGFILFTWYRGWRLAEAIRENRRAIELDPGLSDTELGALFFHAGLYDLWEESNLDSIAMDPANRQLKGTFINEFFLTERPDEGLSMQRRLLGEQQAPDARYFLGKHMVHEAAPLVEAEAAKTPTDRWVMARLMTLRALQGRHAEAQALVEPLLAIVQRNRTYHHFTYSIARICAAAGRSGEALRWLNETVDTGFPNYPLFASDAMLNPIRTVPEFKELLARLRTDFEEFQRAAH